MSVYKSEATGGQFMIPVEVLIATLIVSPETAIVLDLHNQDGSTQEVAGMIPLAPNSDERTNERGEILRRIRPVCD